MLCCSLRKCFYAFFTRSLGCAQQQLRKWHGYLNGTSTFHSGSRGPLTGKQEDGSRPHCFCAYLCHFWQYSVWGRRAHRKWFPKPQASTCQTYRESFFDYGGGGIYLCVY